MITDIKQYKKEYYKNNRPNILARKKENYENNKQEERKKALERYHKLYKKDIKYIERRKKYKKHYYFKNKEKIAKERRKYYLSNINRFKELNRIYRKNNMDRCRFLIKSYKYRKKMAGELPVSRIQLVYEDNIKRYGTLTCYLCENPIEFGKDNLEHRTPLSRGGTNDYNNLAISCSTCNFRKHTKTEEEYRKELVL